MLLGLRDILKMMQVLQQRRLLTSMKSIKVQRILHQLLSKKVVMLFLQLPEPIQVEVLKVLQLFILVHQQVLRPMMILRLLQIKQLNLKLMN